MSVHQSARGLGWHRQWVLGLGALAVAAAVLGGVGQWTSSGPSGTTVYSFAADPSTPSKVFALSVGGLLRSSDGGVHWTTVHSRLEASGLIVGPPPSSSLYAINYQTGELVRSDDEGITWLSFPTNLAADDYVVSMAVDPTAVSTVYIGTLTGLFRSADGGRTWAATAGMPATVVQALAFDPSSPSTIYAATILLSGRSGAVFKSTDSGRNWAVAGTTGLNLVALAVDPSRPTTIYGCAQSGVVRSVDGGATWTSIGAAGSGSYLAIDPGQPSRIYAVTEAGFFRGEDGDAALSPIRFGPGAGEEIRAQAVTVVPSSPSAVLVAARDGILRSTDGGASWALAEAGGHSNIQAVVVCPLALGSVYAGSRGGVFESSDAGGTWTAPDLASPETYALAVVPGDPSTVFAAGRGLSRSADAGATWDPTGEGLPRSTTITALAISPSDPSVMLAGSMAGILYRSTDGGRSFGPTGPTPVDDGGYPAVARSIVFDVSNPEIIYVAGESGGYFSAHDFLLKTINGGAHWANLRLGGAGAFSVVVDPESPSTIYLATWGDGLLKSVDGGTSWLRLSGPTGALVMDPRDHATIYSGGASGVFQSLDAGTSWARLGPELAGDVTSLAIAPDGQRLYAGTWNGGVFDYDLSVPGPCEPGPGSLCLLGGRFRVTVFVTDSRRGRSSSGLAVAQSDRFGYFSLPDFTGDANLPEVFIKMVNASWFTPGSFWVFYNGLTSLPYTIVVTDTSTGARREYANEGFCGGADTAAFPAQRPAGATAAAATLLPTTGSASGSVLSLLGDRFRVALSATNPRDGRVSEGSAMSRGDRFGYFSLPGFTGDPSFPEVWVKMVDATSFSGNFWFFHSGLTGLPYTLTVTDTVTGAVRTYQNGSTGDTRFCGGADTAIPR